MSNEVKMTTYHIVGWLRGARGDFKKDIEAPAYLAGCELVRYLDHKCNDEIGGDIYGCIISYAVDVDYDCLEDES